MLQFLNSVIPESNLKRLNPFTVGILALAMLMTGCAGLSPQAGQDSDVLEGEQAQINLIASQQDTVADATYNLMVAEIALNRGDTDLAVEYYLNVIKTQNNPAIAERAVRVAV